jgi:hypothetical protein
MENTLKIFIVLMLFVFTAPAHAEDIYLDQDFKAYEDAYLKAMKSCWNDYSSAAKTASCEARVKTKYKGDKRARGTDAFCDEKYGSLSLEELRTVRDELIVLSDGAYNYMARIEQRPHGVLGQAVLNAEINYIKNRITGLELEAYCQGQKDQLKQLGLPDSHLPPVCQKYYRLKATQERLKSSE